MELKIKRVEQYMWTMSNRLKPEPITNVKFYLKTKPAVLMVYKNNDKRNFEVHNLFKFRDFWITKLDELGLIIERKKNFIVKDLMTSLGKRYEILKKIHEELRIQSAFPVPVPRQVASQSSGRKRKHIELNLRSKFLGWNAIEVFLMAFHLWIDIHKVRVDSIILYLVMALMVKTQENARFCLKLRKLIAEHPE
ncbi:hypothetical protein Tco_1262255 [Tanacetum coccineum]